MKIVFDRFIKNNIPLYPSVAPFAIPGDGANGDPSPDMAHCDPAHLLRNPPSRVFLKDPPSLWLLEKCVSWKKGVGWTPLEGGPESEWSSRLAAGPGWTPKTVKKNPYPAGLAFFGQKLDVEPQKPLKKKPFCAIFDSFSKIFGDLRQNFFSVQHGFVGLAPALLNPVEWGVVIHRNLSSGLC